MRMIDGMASVGLARKDWAGKPAQTRMPLIKPDCASSINAQTMDATGRDTEMGMKKMLRKSPMPLSFMLTRMARTRARAVCSGLIMTLNNSVTWTDCQNVGSVKSLM